MLTTILFVFAFVLFVLAAALTWAPLEPHRFKLVAAGLACWVAAHLFGPMLK